ncbi:MAG TPA: hypothetical protein PKU78_01060 [Candidatus Dojkabacteria bacterium]|nr:hypothetical protein [Candidatus Dojkabacteria bacterium]HRO64791.1 hypothetical protein [Candidatus Dojkabacteria bacterium]HRP50968.1 hypothetical protein [Candidatus Dojkabacteria bacterium]
MCGIFGLITTKNTFNKAEAKSIVNDLLLLSQSRGKDSSGIAFVRGDEILVYKEPLSASKFIKSKIYNELLSSDVEQYALIGHARMETNGSFSLTHNNQPVVKSGMATIHNGIIVNDNDLWKNHKGLKREFGVDTEVFNALLNERIHKGEGFGASLKKTLQEIKGSYAFGSLFGTYNNLLIATNTGSLFTLSDKEKSFLIFVSEKFFAEEILRKHFKEKNDSIEIKQISPGSGALISLDNLKRQDFEISKDSELKNLKVSAKKRKIQILGKQITEVPIPSHVEDNKKNLKTIESLIKKEYEQDSKEIGKLRRCTKCILPETMPFIEFDDDGVCSYCHAYENREIKGDDELVKDISKYKKGNGEPDCIVAFSGGRDSCYALHYAVEELGLKPLAYSYDWGMITDLGRRNQARMTGQLGVEHILISADIQKKREYIRKNVSAWLKKPEIGMVPLFMAGDKQYFYYLNKLRKETGIDLVIYSGNSLENTYFKHGFANVKLKNKDKKAYEIGMMNSLKLLWYYAAQYSKNPRYLNSSLVDTFGAYLSSYAISKDYLYIYKYLPWSEQEVEDVLLKQYDWELSPDTRSSWRIGDGTASFYNYVYYVMTGLTENDTFRSNQIREGLISRDEALKLSIEENKPRVESMLWYCDTIGIDATYAVEKINSAKKHY